MPPLILALLLGQAPGLPTVRIPPSPTVEIGASATRESDQLYAVVDARLGPDGSIIIAERHARIRVYGPGGALRRDMVGEGGGPGELRELLAVAAADGTVSALGRDGSVVTYTVEGRLLGSRSNRLPRLDDRYNVVPWGVLPNGGVLFKGVERLFGRPAGPYVQRFRALRQEPGGEVEEIGVFAAQDVVVEDGMPWAVAPPTPLLYAASSDGGIWVGSGRRYRLLKVMGGGDVVAVASQEREVSHWTEADRREMIEAAVARGATSNDRRVIREWAEQLPDPDQPPALRSFFVDRRDRLWVERWKRGRAGEGRWVVHDPSGTPLFTVTTPPGLGLTDATETRVLGVHVDGLGRERARVHELPAPGAQMRSPSARSSSAR